jgi:hypothetical protein
MDRGEKAGRCWIEFLIIPFSNVQMKPLVWGLP